MLETKGTAPTQPTPTSPALAGNQNPRPEAWWGSPSQGLMAAVSAQLLGLSARDGLAAR
jgi:hypothetical protein